MFVLSCPYADLCTGFSYLRLRKNEVKSLDFPNKICQEKAWHFIYSHTGIYCRGTNVHITAHINTIGCV